jgi:Oxidoreductase family, NAD-binding Rossmann fold/Oxidoreductase family, C-terminal alpha/beta domain
MNLTSPSTRRGFLKTGAIIATPMVLPARLFGQNSPSNTISLGVIGVGGKGTDGMRNFIAHRSVQVSAVCDVNRKHLNHAGDLAKVPQERRYNDFRELLARDDIDAVLIATPDHWHVLQAKAAVEAGKDVYCEKPVANTIMEGRALVDTVKKHKAVFQHGTQLRSSIANHKVCTLVRNRVIGDVRHVTIGSPPGRASGDHPPEPVPDWLDWDLFQGPAPEKPYTPWRCSRLPEISDLAAWYFISDYSKAGWIAGYGVHDIDLALWGLGITEQDGPVTIEGTGVFPESGLFDTVLTYELRFTWADGRRITMTDTGRNPHGVKFHGDKDWLFCRESMDSSNRDLLRTPIDDLPVKLCASRQHEGNFIECCQSRKETIAPIDAAHRATSLCLAGAISLKLDRKLVWDPQSERFDDAEANKQLAYGMRGPWKI